MKEAIGGTSLFMIFIVVMTVFAIYISLSVNWSMAYKVKDEIIFAIERNGGYNDEAAKQIANTLSNAGYFTTGDCSCFNAYSITTQNTAKQQGNYCLLKYVWNSDGGGIKKGYYLVRVFFKLDLPVIRSFQITIDGETRILEEKPYTSQELASLETTNNGFDNPFNQNKRCNWGTLRE